MCSLHVQLANYSAHTEVQAPSLNDSRFQLCIHPVSRLEAGHLKAFTGISWVSFNCVTSLLKQRSLSPQLGFPPYSAT